jgi:hypothetical protein
MYFVVDNNSINIFVIYQVIIVGLVSKNECFPGVLTLIVRELWSRMWEECKKEPTPIGLFLLWRTFLLLPLLSAILTFMCSAIHLSVKE